MLHHQWCKTRLIPWPSTCMYVIHNNSFHVKGHVCNKRGFREMWGFILAGMPAFGHVVTESIIVGMNWPGISHSVWNIYSKSVIENMWICPWFPLNELWAQVPSTTLHFCHSFSSGEDQQQIKPRSNRQVVMEMYWNKEAPASLLMSHIMPQRLPRWDLWRWIPYLAQLMLEL